MTISVEKLSSNKVKISFDIEAEKFEEAMQKSYLKNRGRVNVPGFRKGKAPRKLIENMYGEGVFYDDAFEALFPEAYDKAVEENALEPVDRPNVDIQQIGSGKNLQFTAEVFVRPDVTLGEYKGLKVERHEHPVTDEQVDAQVEPARQRAGQQSAAEIKARTQPFCPQAQGQIGKNKTADPLDEIERQLPERIEQIEQNVVVGSIGISVAIHPVVNVLEKAEKIAVQRAADQDIAVPRGLNNIGMGKGQQAEDGPEQQNQIFRPHRPAGQRGRPAGRLYFVFEDLCHLRCSPSHAIPNHAFLSNTAVFSRPARGKKKGTGHR